MNTQLLAIGFRPEDSQQLFTFLSMAAERSLPVSGTPQGMEHRLWVDTSGAGLAVHRRAGKIDAMTPWFESDTVWPVEVGAFVPDPETVHWSGVEGTITGGDAPVKGAVIHVRDASAWRPLLLKGGRFMLQMAVFGDDVQVFVSAEEFRAATKAMFGKNERGEEMELSQSLILPTGRQMAGGSKKMADLATALLAGRVISFERRENTVCRKPFRVIRAEVAGHETEIAYWKTRDGREPAAGDLVLAHCWLAGAPLGLTPPEEQPPADGVLSKLFALRGK